MQELACAAQPGVTWWSSVPALGVHRPLVLTASLGTPRVLLCSSSIACIGSPDWFLKQISLHK